MTYQSLNSTTTVLRRHSRGYTMTYSLIVRMIQEDKTTVDIAKSLDVSVDKAAELIELFHK